MVKVNNISKSFGELKAIDNLSFSIKKGEIFGLLGPNGAGKSTLINMMSAILKQDDGQVIINGSDILEHTQLCKHQIGVVPQEISLYGEFSAIDNLVFWGKLYQIPRKELDRRIDEILELIGLRDRKNDLIKTYSGGMKRRINIAAALLHKPDILFMDEPTVGVDPQSRNSIFELVEKLNSSGITVVYTTHYMEEVERLCNRIAIIDKGRIIAQGTTNELKEKSGIAQYIEIEFESITKKQHKELEKLIGLQCHLEESVVLIEAEGNQHLSNIISVCFKCNLLIRDIQIKKANLEAIFLKLTGKQLRD